MKTLLKVMPLLALMMACGDYPVYEDTDTGQTQQELSVKNTGSNVTWGVQAGSYQSETTTSFTGDRYFVKRVLEIGPDTPTQRWVRICVDPALKSAARNAVYEFAIPKLNNQLTNWHFEADTSQPCTLPSAAQNWISTPGTHTMIHVKQNNIAAPNPSETTVGKYAWVTFDQCSSGLPELPTALNGTFRTCRAQVQVNSDALNAHTTFTNDTLINRQAVMKGILAAIGMGQQTANNSQFTYRDFHANVQARTTALGSEQICRAQSLDAMDGISISYEATGC